MGETVASPVVCINSITSAGVRNTPSMLDTEARAVVAAGFLLTAVPDVFSNSYHIYRAEIFPTAIWTTAGGVACSLSRATSTVLPFVAVPALWSFGPCSPTRRCSLFCCASTSASSVPPAPGSNSTAYDYAMMD
ncbi:hypothetical protein HNP40_001476 [Mycobacteroides chelonae]|nr:hypothetical protein [Mycobacteroides chelonae]